MRILMPVDGSAYSKAALAFISSRSTLIESQPEVELINVQYPVSVRVARGAGRELVQHYQVGRMAAKDSADLIVMGSHGHTGFKNLLFGSVTQDVLASCNTPLLVVRGDAIPKKDSLKLGIALDGSKYGLAAVRFIIKHRALFGAAPALTLIHVVPDLLNLRVPGFFADAPVPGFKPDQVEEMQRAGFERALAPARRLLQGTALQVAEAQLKGNNPGDAIAAYAAKNKLDILVMGSHGAGALVSTVLGSVATRVAAKCRKALLFIQEK